MYDDKVLTCLFFQNFFSSLDGRLFRLRREKYEVHVTMTEKKQ